MQNSSIHNKRLIESNYKETNKKLRSAFHDQSEETKPFAIPRLPFTTGRVSVQCAKTIDLPAEVWAEIMGHLLNTSAIDFLNLSQCCRVIRATALGRYPQALFFEALVREKPMVIQAYASHYLKSVDVIATMLKRQYVSLPKNLFYLNFPGKAPRGISEKVKRRIGERRGEVKILELVLPFHKNARLKFFQNVERLILNFNGERFSHTQLQSKPLGRSAPQLKILHIKNAIVGNEHLCHVGFKRLLGCPISEAPPIQKVTLETLVFEDCRIGQDGLAALMETSPQSSIEIFSKFEDRKMIRLFPSRSFYHSDFEQEIYRAACYGTFSVENMRELDFTAVKELYKSDEALGILPVFHAKRDVDESLPEGSVIQREPMRLASVKRYGYARSYPKLEVLHLRKDQLLPHGIRLQTLITEFQRFRAAAPNLRRFIVHSGPRRLECDASEEALATLFGRLTT